jgi:shikimate dehydrogenase
VTDRYAVIGRPVGHSLSPRIHAAFARQTGEDMAYGLLQADTFAGSANAFFDRGGVGLNVTIPYKEDAWRWVDERDVLAEAAGAVNTIVVRGRRRIGCNTDGTGLLRDLAAQDVDPKGLRVLVIGAGGAARGIARPLLACAPAQLVFANRTPERAQQLVLDLIREGGSPEVQGVSFADLHARAFDLVINATAVGQSGVGGMLASAIVEGSICYDLVYRLGGETPFCAWARIARAARVLDGLGMLVEQAAESFRLWRGFAPDPRLVLAQLRG